MRPLISRLVLAVVSLVVIAGLFVPLPHRTVAGTPTTLYLDLVPAPAPGRLSPMGSAIPPNGSAWHELYPAYCAPQTQDDYEDNGNGIVDACDVITLNGIAYHIEWAGPTYYVTCSETPGGPPLGQNIFEPTGNPSSNPICQVWHEIWPNFCREIHIDSFHDTDENGVLNECDYVDVQGTNPSEPPLIFYHIDRIGLDIRIVPLDPTPTERSTWSRIKSFIGGIID